MRNVVVLVVLCILTVFHKVEAIYPWSSPVRYAGLPFSYDTRFNVEQLSKKSHVTISTQAQAFQVHGPKVENGLSCSQLKLLMSARGVSSIYLYCSHSNSDIVSRPTRGTSYHDVFAAGVPITWKQTNNVHIYADIQKMLTVLWSNGYYLRDSIANCFVPYKSHSLDSNKVRATLLIFPHCVGKLPENSFQESSGLEVFETFYYKTLLQLNEYLQLGWFDYLARGGDKLELEKLRSEYSEHAKQKLTLDNYMTWLLLPLRINSAYRGNNEIDSRTELKKRNINTIFNANSMVMRDGVLHMMQLAFGHSFSLSKKEHDHAFPFYKDERCEHFDLQGFNSKYHPLFLKLVMKLKMRPTHTDVDGSSLFHLYNCVFAIEEAGFFVSLPLSLMELGAKVSFPLKFDIDPSVLSFKKEGANSSDLLYLILHKIVGRVVYANIASSPTDRVDLLRSVLRDDRLIDCYENKVCDGTYEGEFPNGECHNRYRNMNGVSKPIKKRIVELCKASAISGNGELHIWTTPADSESIQLLLEEGGMTLTVLNVRINGHEAIFISTSDKLVRVGDMSHNANVGTRPTSQEQVIHKLESQVALHQLLTPFCETQLLQFAGKRRYVCVSNVLDKKAIQYGGNNLSELVMDNAIPLLVVQTVLDFPSLLQINQENLTLAMEDLQSLGGYYDLSVFSTAESTLDELTKVLSGIPSYTFDKLWQMRLMYTSQILSLPFPQSGEVRFSLDTSPFCQAVSLFQFTENSGVYLRVRNCFVVEAADINEAIRCDSQAFDSLENVISNFTTRDEIINGLCKYSNIVTILWQETANMISISNGRYKIFPVKSDSSKTDYYTKTVLSVLFENKIRQNDITSNNVAIDDHVEALELTVEEFQHALVAVKEGSEVDIRSKFFVDQILLLSSSDLSEAKNERLSLTLEFWNINRRLGYFPPELLRIIEQYQLTGLNSHNGFLTVDLRIPEEYTSSLYKLAPFQKCRRNLATAIQVVKLHELIQLYMPGNTIAVCANKAYVVIPDSHVYAAIIDGKDLCFGVQRKSLSTHDVNGESRGLTLFSAVMKTAFPTFQASMKSLKNILEIAGELGVVDINDESQTINTTQINRTESEFWKLVAEFSNKLFVISSNFSDPNDHDTTRKGFIINILEMTKVIYSQGVIARVCPGELSSPFYINFFMPKRRADVHNYFASLCPKRDELLNNERGDNNSNRNLGSMFSSLVGSIFSPSSDIASSSKNKKKKKKTNEENPLLDLLKTLNTEGGSNIASSYKKLGDIDDYVLQSIGLVASYLGPRRKTPLQVFDKAELDEFKAKIGYPSDGSIKVGDLAKAIDEVESLNVGQKDPYDDEFPDVPETLSPAGKVLYNIFYKLDIERCPVCHGDIFVADGNQVKVGLCGHIYHRECSDGTMVDDHCAVCRQPRPFSYMQNQSWTYSQMSS